VTATAAASIENRRIPIASSDQNDLVAVTYQ
jgi:hypothetical protein